MRLRRVAAGTAALAVAAAFVGPRLWRLMLDWHAVDDEAQRPLPGDDLLPAADLVATRAISIAAPPSAVWPWLVQIGVGRAGAYSYDWLDRLFGLDLRSSRRIVPEFQGLSVNDVIPIANDGTGLRVRLIEPGRVLATLTDDGTWAWTWILAPEGAGTRLLSRTRMSTVHSSLAGRAATWLLLVPASWVMERRMLLGLRERAESAFATLSSGESATAGPAVSPARRAALRRPPRETHALPYEIAPDVYCLGPRGRTQTNVYLVHAGPHWALVDAGWERDAERIAAATHSLLGPDLTPSAVLLTHDHPDHAGAARVLAETWHCPILVRGAEVPIAMGDFGAMERFGGPLDRWLILPAMRAIGERRREAILQRGSLAGMIRELEPDGSIPGLDGWTWIPTPGHTPGSVTYLRAADRVVLTGDALVTLLVNSPSGFLRGSPGLSSPPWYTTWDAREAIASIEAIAALGPSVVCGGHGRPMSGAGTPAAVRSFALRTARSG